MEPYVFCFFYQILRGIYDLLQTYYLPHASVFFQVVFPSLWEWVLNEWMMNNTWISDNFHAGRTNRPAQVAGALWLTGQRGGKTISFQKLWLYEVKKLGEGSKLNSSPEESAILEGLHRCLHTHTTHTSKVSDYSGVQYRTQGGKNQWQPPAVMNKSMLCSHLTEEFLCAY
jgi:hypothetical protein